jgi:hypothetical protein
MAKDFVTNEDLETLEYCMYFKFSNCAVGTKDSRSTAGGLFRDSPSSASADLAV